MSDDDRCPHCGVSLVGDPIPTDMQQFYGGKTHASRRVLVEVPGVYDGALFCRCPDCGGQWHRHREGSPLRALAERFVRGDRKTVRCDLTDLLLAECAHCVRRDADEGERARRELLQQPDWFMARYPGVCSGCGGPFDAGIPIRTAGAAGNMWVADCCAEGEK